MKTISEKTFYVVVIAVLLIAAGLVMFQARPVRANVYTGTVLSTATTSASFSVTNSARVLATTSPNDNGYTRVYATICNPNANPVFLNLDGDKPAGVGKVTTVIAAAAGYDACYEITDRNMYQGSVTASSTNQTATVIDVKDYVQ